MKKVSLIVICKDQDDADHVAKEMINSPIAQHGAFTLGTYIEDCTAEEEQEVLFQLPEDNEVVEITKEQEEGIKMIQFLQKIGGIDESREKALTGWNGLSEKGKESTRSAYSVFHKDSN